MNRQERAIATLSTFVITLMRRNFVSYKSFVVIHGGTDAEPVAH